jgi:nucleotide-binding universal stress UspA family protein
MRYVVGYTNSSRGKDAVRLASALAKGQDVQLEIVVVTPKPRVTYDMYSPDRSYFAHLEAQASEWLDDAMALVPDDVVAKPHHQFGESIAEGLINAASGDQREEAALIVVGASQRGVSGYFTIGSIASSLLHSSPVPVALAPAGYGAQHEKIVRLTCAMGTRPGAENLLDVAVKNRSSASDRASSCVFAEVGSAFHA